MKLALLLFAILPLPGVKTDHVAMVEHHTRMSSEGKPEFRQWIFYDFDARTNRHRVVDWLVDNNQVQREGNTYIFHRYGVLYRVHADHRRESVTQSDPEQIDQAVWPVSRRRKLWGGKP